MSQNNAEGTRRDSVVIIPMYNEKENAAAIIEAVLALPHGFDIPVSYKHPRAHATPEPIVSRLSFVKNKNDIQIRIQ